MHKTKLVLLTAAALLAIASGAEAAKVKRSSGFSMGRPASVKPVQKPAPVTNPVPGRPAASTQAAPQTAPAAAPAKQAAPAANQAPAQQAAPAANAAPAQPQQQGGGFMSNMMGAAAGAVAGSMIGEALFGDDKTAQAQQPAEAQQQPAEAQAQQPAQPASAAPLNPPSSSLLRSLPNKAHGATLLTRSPQGMPSRAFPCSDTMDGLQTLEDPPPCSPLSPFPLLKAPQVP